MSLNENGDDVIHADTPASKKFRRRCYDGPLQLKFKGWFLLWFKLAIVAIVLTIWLCFIFHGSSHATTHQPKVTAFFPIIDEAGEHAHDNVYKAGTYFSRDPYYVLRADHVSVWDFMITQAKKDENPAHYVYLWELREVNRE